VPSNRALFKISRRRRWLTVHRIHKKLFDSSTSARLSATLLQGHKPKQVHRFQLYFSS
jgi:hypothetical protein